MLVFARTHRGKVRPNNEDAIALESWTSGDADQLSAPRRSDWVVVADGIGGHAHGEIASELAVGMIGEMLPAVTEPTEIQRIIEAVHARLHELINLHEALEGMGTTIVGVLRRQNKIFGFNVGDSRLYRFRHGTLELISHDDSVGHALTQCLGGRAQRSAPMAHIAEWEGAPGERLLLCSDGLSNMVDARDLRRVLSSSSGDPAQALVDAALDAGGQDNISVAVAQL